ncbi:uncharacterized protein NEMAJ01_0836 [Nematocida major]|uniref:uncharacterized protein n=1 Tax=Nematocida major TaxID=1912982 RepID=UPI002007C49D|nr:uncharacterized protein NEMAJ01_0836 [Nematocida major]KAH9385940.1 hypothetical protein NEMAJ01_0836 [Nematocida major]
MLWAAGRFCAPVLAPFLAQKSAHLVLKEKQRMSMQKKQTDYDKSTAKMFLDPYKYVIEVHIENIQKPENTVEIKKEYITGLETILVRQDISTASSIFPLIAKCVGLLDVPGLEEDVCVMLGHISQNVEPVARELVRCQVLSRCMELYRKRPEAVNKMLFLLTVINNTVKDLRSALEASGQDPAALKCISATDEHMSEKSKERLCDILSSLNVK